MSSLPHHVSSSTRSEKELWDWDGTQPPCRICLPRPPARTGPYRGVQVQPCALCDRWGGGTAAPTWGFWLRALVVLHSARSSPGEEKLRAEPWGALAKTWEPSKLNGDTDFPGLGHNTLPKPHFWVPRGLWQLRPE